MEERSVEQRKQEQQARCNAYRATIIKWSKRCDNERMLANVCAVCKRYEEYQNEYHEITSNIMKS